mmetsp:Transcript_87042/g.244092  ORF Transcript_87042/g.244092 Transcript_87042/m.244092 type:complete len:213 (+) Transcript_87042:1311-1949(+)
MLGRSVKVELHKVVCGAVALEEGARRPSQLDGVAVVFDPRRREPVHHVEPSRSRFGLVGCQVDRRLALAISRKAVLRAQTPPVLRPMRTLVSPVRNFLVWRREGVLHVEAMEATVVVVIGARIPLRPQRQARSWRMPSATRSQARFQVGRESAQRARSGGQLLHPADAAHRIHNFFQPLDRIRMARSRQLLHHRARAWGIPRPNAQAYAVGP